MSAFLEIPVDMIDSIDRERAERARFNSEHARYFFRRVFPSLPAIHVLVREGTVVATGRGNLLPIAKELGHKTIQVIVEPTSDSAAVANLLAQPHVRRLTQAEIFPDENPFDPQWHVLFFSSRLNRAEREQFDAVVLSKFAVEASPALRLHGGPTVLELSWLKGGEGVEFRAVTPAADEAWTISLVRALQTFHQRVKGIVSYQGSEFIGPEQRLA